MSTSRSSPPQPPAELVQSNSTAASSSTRTSVESARNPFPFSFRRPFQPNISSTSLVSSTAEGRAIPVDDTTVEHRTSALRELNHNYPSRHRYAESTGAQSSTYSEPVIVRSYYSPAPSRQDGNNRGRIFAPTALFSSSTSSQSPSVVARVLPFASQLSASSSGNGIMSGISRSRAKKFAGAVGPDQARLPPVDAFTFKSFLANMEAQGAGNDISADLDRIAEICARSRYSLSNQYEVHYAPHGSGTAFLSPSSHEAPGPTLQAISSDDERVMRRQKKRRNGARRRSRAMGTLETIMSSSRSSDEERSAKRSAAEIAEEVRGRAARKHSDESSPTVSTDSTFNDEHSPEIDALRKPNPGKKSASLALIEGKRQGLSHGDESNPRSSNPGLVSEPAMPQASTSQLEIRTGSDEPHHEHYTYQGTRPVPVYTNKTYEQKESVSTEGGLAAAPGLLASLSAWMPWRTNTTTNSQARAEGTLRELLRSTDVKGKGVTRSE
ncbi:hypothetical protein B0I35DRAFT_244245 [Stachybotrys elegans]|uniref:Uncharacterized protein n=1 Tax=Stachybotrys elegans TaxID=80388 RepID=A0A8K0SUW5_9HYPO|nr:hypothetical protein B0I35DRAFT_244245 [Stachybotrys elegans]